MGKKRVRPFSATWGPQSESDWALDAWLFSLSLSQRLLEQREGSGPLCECRMGRRSPQKGQKPPARLKATWAGPKGELEHGQAPALGCLITRERLDWGNLPQRQPSTLIQSVCH